MVPSTITDSGTWPGVGDLGDIQYVGFSTSSASGTIDDFALTIIPEPGSLALMSLGGLLIARRRRGN